MSESWSRAVLPQKSRGEGPFRLQFEDVTAAPKRARPLADSSDAGYIPPVQVSPRHCDRELRAASAAPRGWFRREAPAHRRVRQQTSASRAASRRRRARSDSCEQLCLDRVGLENRDLRQHRAFPGPAIGDELSFRRLEEPCTSSAISAPFAASASTTSVGTSSRIDAPIITRVRSRRRPRRR